MKTLHKPVIFIDFGEVYFHGSKPLLSVFSKKYGISQKKIYGTIMAYWTEYATGRSDDVTYWKSFGDHLKISEEQTKAFRRAWWNYSKPKRGMPNLIKKLRKNYRVAALSSINSSWVEVLEKKFKISQRFHDHHYSYDHGIDKPDAGFFLSAAKKMNVEPEDCIVVDDMKNFLADVKKTGAKTVLFKDAKQLERELNKLGVSV